MPAQNQEPGSKRSFDPDRSRFVSSAAKKESLVATCTLVSIEPGEHAPEIAKGKSWLENKEYRKAHQESSHEGSDEAEPTLEDFPTSQGFHWSSKSTVKEIVSNELPKFVLHSLISELVALGKRIEEADEDAWQDDDDDEFGQGPEDFAQALLSVQGRSISAHQTSARDMKARIVKGETVALIFNDGKHIDDDYVKVELETLEAIDRRIEEEEEEKMQAELEVALQGINGWEKAWKEYWNLDEEDRDSEPSNQESTSQ